MIIPTSDNTPIMHRSAPSTMRNHSSTLTPRLPVSGHDRVDEPPTQREGDDARDRVVGDVADQRHNEPRLVRPLLGRRELRDLVNQFFGFRKHERPYPCAGRESVGDVTAGEHLAPPRLYPKQIIDAKTRRRANCASHVPFTRE